jgi:hypothetical protein
MCGAPDWATRPHHTELIGLTNRTKSPTLSSEALTLRVELPALQRLTTKEAAAPEA